LESELVSLLDRLRFGENASERNQALKDLKLYESEGRIKEEDLLNLLGDKDFVFQTYAIGAIGRLKLGRAIDRLCEMFEKSTDPLILPLLLDAFIRFGSDQFCSCVEKKLFNLEKKKEENPEGDHSFILEHILVPSLKYFQGSGNQKVKETISRFLINEDPIVRWNALIAFDKLELTISKEELETIRKNDSYVLVREQADIMLEKRKKSS
jgi:hypothetical protein